jgi:hypothetical protein
MAIPGADTSVDPGGQLYDMGETTNLMMRHPSRTKSKKDRLGRGPESEQSR